MITETELSALRRDKTISLRLQLIINDFHVALTSLQTYREMMIERLKPVIFCGHCGLPAEPDELFLSECCEAPIYSDAKLSRRVER